MMDTVGEPTDIPLAFVPSEAYDDNGGYVRVPIADIIGRKAISTLELAVLAHNTTSQDFPAESERVTACLDSLDVTMPNHLRVFGPDEGDYYIELPLVQGEQVTPPESSAL